MLSSLVKSSSSLRRTVACGTSSFSSERILSLNDLHNVEGSRMPKRRWGRGIGSGRGKNAGHGHQKSRSTPRGFEGGQTPLYKRLPKIGFHNHNERDLQFVNLNTIQEFIDKKRLVPKANNMINVRNLLECGIISSAKEGVKLLALGKETLKHPIHMEVSFASEEAIKAVEKAGGTVTCVHFNRLALRALIKPLKFDLLPKRARPSPKIMDYYLDRTKCGYLSPEIQTRNLAMFGFVTTEDQMREEHQQVQHFRRRCEAVEREYLLEEMTRRADEREEQELQKQEASADAAEGK